MFMNVIKRIFFLVFLMLINQCNAAHLNKTLIAQTKTTLEFFKGTTLEEMYAITRRKISTENDFKIFIKSYMKQFNAYLKDFPYVHYVMLLEQYQDRLEKKEVRLKKAIKKVTTKIAKLTKSNSSYTQLNDEKKEMEELLKSIESLQGQLYFIIDAVKDADFYIQELQNYTISQKTKQTYNLVFWNTLFS